MSSFKFAIIGGDYRYKILSDILTSDGYKVKSYKNKHISENAANLDELLEDTNVLIAPIPCSKDNKSLFFSDADDTIMLKDLFDKMKYNSIKLFVGGVISEEIEKLASSYDIKTFDYFAQESVAVLNAIATAEGAIQVAMQESNRTIFGSKSLVLGYGRCGKILANTLNGIGADVSVTYRNEKDSSYIKAYGYEGIRLSSLECCIDNFNFIYNTIPAEILNRKLLKKINKNAIIIDIAQSPGGVDYSFARDVNLKAIYCPGLPGRVAPYTAAEILKDAIINISLSQLY